MLNKRAFHLFSSVAPALRSSTTGGGGGDSQGKSDFSGADNKEGRSPSSQDEEFPLCISTSPPTSLLHSSPYAWPRKTQRVLLVRQGRLMEKGLPLPLPGCLGRFALTPVRLSESRLSKFILVSIFIVPPTDQYRAKTLRQTL